MEDTLLHTGLCVLLVLVLQLFSHVRAKRRNLPPGPSGLPVIGHLHLLKMPLHRTLHGLARKYGPILSLRFGSKLVVVVSTPSAVEECFGKNDVIFANRPQVLVGKYMNYDSSTMVFAPYGSQWRSLRRMGATEIFSGTRIQAFLGIRKDEVLNLLRSLYQNSARDFARVQLRPMLTELTFNNVTRMVAGKRFYGEDLDVYEDSKKVQALIHEFLEYGGANTPEDYLPFLRWIGYRKVENKMFKIGQAMDAFFQGLIDENRSDRGRNTMINHLLSLQESQPQQYTDLVIKGLIDVMILGGTDTSAATLEWAMALLLNHPEVLKKARTELETQVGQDRLIEESDLPKLPYLNCIISETFRLCPVAPILLPHLSSQDCTIGGYKVPRGIILIANVWAIQRDPETYDNPSEYRPERFEGVDIEAHKLLPFGMGRRICPGSGLAQRLIGFTLGSMIQCFDWQRVSEEPVDLTEAHGVTMPLGNPVEAMCKARDIMSRVFAADS